MALLRLFSYIFDWLIIILIAGIGAGLSYVRPKHKAFSLLDLSISNPLVDETISTSTLVLVALVAPAVLIILITLALVPGRRYARRIDKAALMRLKLWELQSGLAGLCLSVACAFFITQGAKNLFGKPRPDFLARCQPDLTNIAAHVVGGYGLDISERWVMVDSGICTQQNLAILNDGFRSFPSGHSSWSWSGLLYLSLYLCAKFAITIPHLPASVLRTQQPTASTAYEGSSTRKPPHYEPISDGTASEQSPRLSSGPRPITPSFDVRNAAAAPPNYLIIPAFIPIAVAIYICSTRYVEYYHFGFDIITGSLIGITTSWFAFRWYHLPIARGHGWAWAPRSNDRAFGIGVGTQGYNEADNWNDAEAGVAPMRSDSGAGQV